MPTPSPGAPRPAADPGARDAGFFATLPKAELHLHIEGSLTPARLLALGEKNGVELPYGDEDAVLAAYQFDDLQSFLDLYYQGMSVLRTEEDFRDLTLDYLEVCRRERILHCEIGFDPQAHTERGVPLPVVVSGIGAALAEARRGWRQSGALILNFLRHLPAEHAMATLKAAEPYLDDVVAVGLDSSEVGFPPEPFADVFARARSLGLRCVAHAGEEGPPAYVWGALDALQVERIDHGIRAEEDAALLERLAASRIPLTVCPLSNVRLKAVPDLAQHNLRRLLHRGLLVTVNSDDPSYFGGYLSENFARCAAALGLTLAESAQLARNSFAASFLPDSQRARLTAEVDAWESLQA
ncbi:MAG: adenosine deaminase [Gammaproteobacteria bacterium]|nr:adenosine deaminase [Gammaproteobacteria bacterium]|tara:strand:+ start:1223 stop:2284 length:1062 start_codon:yes stop_codon:yes gene_type:complete